jgi:hypothetical protein
MYVLYTTGNRVLTAENFSINRRKYMDRLKLSYFWLCQIVPLKVVGPPKITRRCVRLGCRK